MSGVVRHSAAWALAIVLLSPEAVAAVRETDEDDEAGSWLHRLGLGIEGDIELLLEEQSGDTGTELTFDEAGLTLERDGLEGELGLKVETDGETRLRVENAWIAIGGTARVPARLTVGRDVMPFGSYESQLIEDPLTAALGETDDASVTLAFVTESTVLSLSGFTGQSAQDGDVDLILSAERTAGDWCVAVSWSHDLAESVELRELLDERAESGATRAPDAVSALATSITGTRGRATIGAEIVYALGSFPPGTLDERRRRPLAWSTELAARIAPRWTLAARVDGSRELPGLAELRVGACASHELLDWLHGTLDLVRASMPGADPVHLVGLALGIEL